MGVDILRTGGETFGARIDGLNSLLRRLESMSGEMKAGLISAGMKAGRPTLVRAKLEVPVKSGALRDSIRLKPTRRGVRIAAGSRKVPYAAAVHFGHRRENLATPYRFRQASLKAQPFLFRAVDRTYPQVADIYLAELVALWGAA